MTKRYPISVALIGAPGAGKHVLAEEFAKQFHLKTGEWLGVVESPARRLEDWGRPVGIHGDYRDTLEIHFLRQGEEASYREENESFVSVGTLVENLAHGGVKVEDVRTGFQTPDQEQRIMKEMHATTVMTFLMLDSYRYTFAFYLPLKNNSDLIVPGADSADDAYARRIDNGIRIVINNFNLRIPMLGQPTVEENAADMVNTILAVFEAQETQAKQDDLTDETLMAAMNPPGSGDNVTA